MAAAAGSGAKGAAKSPGAQALLRGVVFSTLAVSTGDYICQWCVHVASRRLCFWFACAGAGGGEQKKGGRAASGLINHETAALVDPTHTPRHTPMPTYDRIEDPSRWDRGRTLRMATATACVMSPASWCVLVSCVLVCYGPSDRSQAVPP